MKKIIKKKKYILLKLIIIIIISIICALILINYFSKKVGPLFLSYAKGEVRKITISIINESVNHDIIDNINDSNIFDIIRNNDGEIQLISYNSREVNNILSLITKSVYDNLSKIENGNISSLDTSNDFYNTYDKNLLEKGIICEIPSFYFLSSSLIANTGPKIPVRFEVIKDVSSNIKTDISEYGINNAFLKVSINITVTSRVILPFISDEIIISNNIPISLKIIQGSVPNYYAGGLSSSFLYK